MERIRALDWSRVAQEARTGAETLGADRVLVYDYPDTKLPLHWAQIPDCTLNGLTFACPLPSGADQCGAKCGTANSGKEGGHSK